MGTPLLVEDAHHSLLGVFSARQSGAQLPGLAPSRRVRRVLGTTLIGTLQLGCDEVDHFFPGMLAAKLHLTAALAERCHFTARRMAAPLVDDVDHSYVGVAGAKLGLSCTTNAVVRPCGAACVAAPYAADIGHS